jgi:hypothetical protein
MKMGVKTKQNMHRNMNPSPSHAGQWYFVGFESGKLWVESMRVGNSHIKMENPICSVKERSA